MIPTVAEKVIVPEVLTSRVILYLLGVVAAVVVAAVGEEDNMIVILLLIECSCSFLVLSKFYPTNLTK